MADAKISELSELSTVSASDVVPIVSGGTTQKIQQTNLIPDATTAIKGKVELATDAETITGTDTGRAVTPSNITGKIDTDGTMAGNSDTRIPSQKAVQTKITAQKDVTETLTNKTITLPVFTNGAIQFNAPDGTLINGKLSVTVASNNLTVALKTYAGTDPSATDPAYIVINNTKYSITAALSKIINAGANYFNAGSAELATKELDWFAYLSYNSTDGVVLGYSRYVGSIYSDFSATTTNEKFLIYSGANASASDTFVCIGRFAATLSAGAGYTWSVPSFTASNLIQKPTQKTRWMDFVPTWGGFSANPTATARFMIDGNRLSFYVFCTAAGTSNAATTSLTLPFSVSDNMQVSTGCIMLRAYDNTGGSQNISVGVFGTNTRIDCYLTPSLTGWTNSGAKLVQVPVNSYEI